MSWRKLGAFGDYPAWVRDLDGRSGVYAIRRPGLLAWEVLYVGESHTGRLRKTLTRHFSGWSRGKDWWSGIFGSPNDPGLTYNRAAVEVRVWLCPAGDAIELQDRLIRKLGPRDNVQRAGGASPVPF